MANYDDLKKKAKDAIETIADVSAEAYKIAEENAKLLARKAKLNVEITREKSQIRRIKSEIGNKYYELHKDDPEEAFAENCKDITDSLTRIDIRRKELEDLKNNPQSYGSDDESCEPEAQSEPESQPVSEPESGNEQ